MKCKEKYSKDLLTEAVRDCFSMQQVLKKLGLRMSGGNHSHIKSRVKFHNVDISHFTGQRTNSGKNHIGGCAKKHWTEILIFDGRDGRREKAWLLRRSLLEAGVEHKCNECTMPPEWNGKVLVLEIDHIDENFLNNLKENLQFLCPNCHSQK